MRGCPWPQATIGRMFNLDQDIPEPLRPLAWLIGRWEGAGVVGYPTIESAHFGQEVEVTPRRTRLPQVARAEPGSSTPRTAPRCARPPSRSGFWRPLENGEVELLLAHPTGILELYYGTIEPAKIQLKTDGVLRAPGAKEYNAATPDVRPRRLQPACGSWTWPRSARSSRATCRPRSSVWNEAYAVSVPPDMSDVEVPTRSTTRSPLLSRPGAVAGDGLDAGVALHYGDPCASSACSRRASRSSTCRTATSSPSPAPTGSAGCTR